MKTQEKHIKNFTRTIHSFPHRTPGDSYSGQRIKMQHFQFIHKFKNANDVRNLPGVRKLVSMSLGG